jgi:hypothetical protein
MLYWYNWFSWWRARGCSKHLENWCKQIEKRTVCQLGHLQELKSGYFSTCKYIHNNICALMSLKGYFNFAIPWHLLKALNKPTKSLSQYSISAPECKLRHSRIRSGSPDMTENVGLNTEFINRGCQLTLYHNIPKTGLMLHYTRDVQITGYPCIEQKAPDKNGIYRSVQNCGSSVQNVLMSHFWRLEVRGGS